MNPEILELFCQAVSDVGSLSWWAANDECFQVEFAGTQLLGEPLEEGGPPCGTIAVRFSGDVQARFLRRAESALPFDWPQKLHGDQLNPLRLQMTHRFLWHEADADKDREWCNQVEQHGLPGAEAAIRPERLAQLPWRMLVWAGDVGIAVAARQAEPMTHAGALDWSELPDLYRRWWAYWQSYWKVRGGAAPLPWDYACEATIPVEA